MRNVWVLGLIVAGSAFASSLAVEFGGETSQMDSYAEAGKTWAQSDALALTLGVRTDAAPVGGKLTFRLGKKISYAAPITVRGKRTYAVALEVARNLGYTATLAGDGSRLILKYEKKVRCEDFEFQEQAQRFYRAASPQAIIVTHTVWTTTLTARRANPYPNSSSDALTSPFITTRV